MRVGSGKHRVRVADRSKQTVRRHVAGADGMTTRSQEYEPTWPRCLRVVLRSANASAMRCAQNHRTAEPPLSSIAKPGGVIHQLIDARIEEAHKLDLSDRPQSLRRHADAKAAIRASESGVSKTRSMPKRCCNPSVARNTPP